MHLRGLMVENYRGIESLRLRFDDDFGRIRPVTVLAGPNGCGKTTVLFAIVQALRGSMGYRSDDVPEPTRLDVRRGGSGPELRTRPVEVRVTLDLSIASEEAGAIRDVFLATREIPGSPDEARLPAIEEGVELVWAYPPEVAPDGRRRPSWWVRSTKPKDAVFWLKGRQYAIRGKNQRIIQDINILDSIGGLMLFPQDRSLRDRVLRADPAHAAGRVGENQGLPDDDDANPRLRPPQDVWGILQYLSTYVHSRETPLPDESNWEKKIQTVFHRICAPKEYVGFRYEEGDSFGAPYLRENGAEYPLHLASSGEQVVLEYLARLTYPDPLHQSLILIDEPEVHLHPAWVRKLYYALPHMGRNNQFVITTHSAELRALAAQDGALIDLGRLDEPIRSEGRGADDGD